MKKYLFLLIAPIICICAAYALTVETGDKFEFAFGSIAEYNTPLQYFTWTGEYPADHVSPIMESLVKTAELYYTVDTDAHTITAVYEPQGVQIPSGDIGVIQFASHTPTSPEAVQFVQPASGDPRSVQFSGRAEDGGIEFKIISVSGKTRTGKNLPIEVVEMPERLQIVDTPIDVLKVFFRIRPVADNS